MNKSMKIAAAIVAGAALITSALAAEEKRVTPKEAEAMVKKGVAYIKANPRDKAMAEITEKTGQFVDRELYLTVYKMDGTALAHGANAKFVGKNMIDLRDAEGKEHIRERMELAKTKSSFWQLLLAGLQVHQPGEQEDRAEADVLREGRRAGRLRRHLQADVSGRHF
jgi:cytochrome c